MTLAPLVLAGCGNDNLDESQQLGPLRVLALIASAPEVAPGQTTIVTPFVSDYDRGGEPGRTWSFSWMTCPDPGIPYGAEPECLTSIASGTGTLSTLNAANAYTALSNSAISITVPDATSPFWTSRTAIDQQNGVPLILQVTVTAGEESTTAFRRINVTSRGTLNAKPGPIIGITPASLPTSEGKVRPVFADTADSYSITTSDGSVISRTEKLTVSWYTTSGEFKFNRTDRNTENTWTPPTGGTAKVFLFLRDDRGGVSDAFSP